MFGIWYRITDWFKDTSERYKTLRSFNLSAKEAFVEGIAPTLLEAKISRGCPEFRHSFSWIMSGFRIKALVGRGLNREEMITIGKIILENIPLTRRLIALGFDTLEVHDNQSQFGVKWKLTDFVEIKILPKPN